MIGRVFHTKLHQLELPQTARRKPYVGLAAFLRLNSEAEANHGRSRKEALLPDRHLQPVIVEVNTLSAAELRCGFLEWRKAGGSLLATPLDRAQFRDFDEFTPEETLKRLEGYTGRTHVVQSYPAGAFEAYAIFDGDGYTRSFLKENAPWNNPRLNPGVTRRVYGTASLLWEVLFENALLQNPRFWRAQKVSFFGEAVVTRETWLRLTLMSLRTKEEQRQLSGREVLTSLLHIKVFRSLLFEDTPTLAKLEEDISIPTDVMVPFLIEIKAYYDLLKRANLIT